MPTKSDFEGVARWKRIFKLLIQLKIKFEFFQIFFLFSAFWHFQLNQRRNVVSIIIPKSSIRQFNACTASSRPAAIVRVTNSARPPPNSASVFANRIGMCRTATPLVSP